jgi:hypothetical protein
MHREVPKTVQELLRERIASFEQLEILLLLFRRRDQTWTSEAVYKELGIPPSHASDGLDHLVRGNLVDVRVGGASLLFRFNPGTPELERGVAELQQTFAERPVDVLRLLSEFAVQRVRTSAMKMFADAFVIGKRRKSDG